MSDRDTQLDRVLEKLLEGVPLSTLRDQYPDFSLELGAFDALVSELHSHSSLVPQADKLREALSWAPVKDTVPQPSPFLSFFYAYRGVLVLPVILIVVVGSGFLWRENSVLPSTSPLLLTPTVQDSGAGQTAGTEGTSGAPTPTSFKSAPGPESRTMLMMAPPEEGTTTATSSATTTPENF